MIGTSNAVVVTVRCVCGWSSVGTDQEWMEKMLEWHIVSTHTRDDIGPDRIQPMGKDNA